MGSDPNTSMSADPNTSSLPVSSALDEETARAEVYGLLAQLYYAPATPPLLDALRVAVTEAPAAGAYLEEPWRDLVAVARALDNRAVAAEYDALFGGVGKPEIYLFGSHYLSAGDDVEVANLTRQREFFAAHLQPWAAALCDAIAAHPKARFYAALAGFTRAFMSVEVQAFDMLD